LFIFTIPTIETSNLNVGSSSLSARTSKNEGVLLGWVVWLWRISVGYSLEMMWLTLWWMFVF